MNLYRPSFVDLATSIYSLVLIASMLRNHFINGFQLENRGSTILRSRLRTAKRELRLGKPREGCRAVAAKRRRRACLEYLNELRLGKPCERCRDERRRLWQILLPAPCKTRQELQQPKRPEELPPILVLFSAAARLLQASS
jgi:hypothetical protein